MISQELLKELQAIMKEDYGLTLDGEDLVGFANMLIAFFQILSKTEGNQAI